ncbi:glycoside hydrolase family 2 [Parabacteroides sp. OttesenSCG-928-G07]|nr:glycoside hydrolase family 2 [Parabacteroides sp. OttesenSCG-928-G21]MDL2277984.1 glycoside hydrolase family 2 [Parabacteroides sp. OttesenSCG-928-G07]
MKYIRLLLFVCFVVACFLSSCTKKTSMNSLEKGFREVPDSVRLAAYWYWISDNISKEGVVNDLHAMKKAGITRAFIGNIGIDDIPYGNVKIFTPEWWDILHTALKTATELDIEIGIFNSPGWSQSGGPWVKQDESMRYLASSDIQVKGPQSLHVAYPGFDEETQLVRVIAYPAPINTYQKKWTLQKKQNQSLTLDMPVDDEQVIRSFIFQTNDPINTEAELQIKEGDTYRTLRKFEIDRSNPALNVGFDPFAPVVLSLPDTQVSAFRLILNAPGSGDAVVTLSTTPVVERYPEQSLAKMHQYPLPYWPTYMWPKKEWYDSSTGFVIPQDEVIDITTSFADGMIKWNVPEGNWVISCLEMKTTGVTNSPATPEATGLEIDKMSKTHVATHFDAFMGEILRRIPEADRKCFKVVVQDSYETGGQNWTDDMIERFKDTYGYDPLPYLPAMHGKVVGNEDMSSRFLWDLRRLIADRVSYDYVGGLRDISHKHGLTTWLENYGHWGFPGEFLQYGGQSDEVSGEFWSVGELGDIENRAASSSAHIYGKRRVWAESFTSGGPNFGRFPYDMKLRGDRFFTEGINATLLHLYIQQPYEDREPGMSAWFGNDFQRKNTWFSQMDVFFNYLRRINFMLQQGLYVADIAYFIGEDAPKMTGVTDPAPPKGYSYDYINAEVLMTRASVKNGRLVLPDGMQYRLLILPKQESMRPELLNRIKELVQEGLAIYGEPPVYSPSLANYPNADKEVQRLAQELFSQEQYGKGTVYRSNTALQKVLDNLGVVPDFKVSDNTPVLFIHRTTEDGDVYFVSNQTDRKISFPCTFRVTDMEPELWNPVTGEIRRLPDYTQEGQVTSLSMDLDVKESAFIVFRKKGKSISNKASNYPEKNVVHTISSSWQVAFESGKRGPETPVTFNTLIDWKDSTDERIKYFSGEAVYSTSFTLDTLPSEELYVDLGNVMVMAKVKLNDQYIGGVWTYPYRLNVTDYLRAGKNTLEITVVNNWQNRLIGDQRLPENQRKTWTTVNPWNANSDLQVSGLLGPVEIQSYAYDILQR